MRTVTEMVAVQDAYKMRAVQGVVFFGYNGLDPQTVPWNRVVRAYVLPHLLEGLEKERPGHPLVSVFKPLLQKANKRSSARRRTIFGRLSRAGYRLPARRPCWKSSLVGWSRG